MPKRRRMPGGMPAPKRSGASLQRKTHRTNSINANHPGSKDRFTRVVSAFKRQVSLPLGALVVVPGFVCVFVAADAVAVSAAAAVAASSLASWRHRSDYS